MTKNWVDPEAKSEAERYEQPIPSRTLILETLEKLSEAQSHSDLVRYFGLDGADDLKNRRSPKPSFKCDGARRSIGQRRHFVPIGG